MTLSIETYDFDKNQYIIYQFSDLKYSNNYSDKGSGFGYCNFSLPRQIGLNYLDIAYGYRVKVRSGINEILFDGFLTQIDEVTGEDGDKINISSLGFVNLFSYDLLNFIMTDNRLEQWYKGCSRKGDYRPDKFDFLKEWDSENAKESITISLLNELSQRLSVLLFNKISDKIIQQLDYLSNNNKYSINLFMDIDELLIDISNNKLMYNSNTTMYNYIFNKLDIYKLTRVKKGIKLSVKDGMSFGCVTDDCLEFKKDVSEYAYYEYYSKFNDPITILEGDITVEFPKGANFKVTILNEYDNILWSSGGKTGYNGKNNRYSGKIKVLTNIDYKGDPLYKECFKIRVKFECNLAGIIYTSTDAASTSSGCYVAIESPKIYCKYKELSNTSVGLSVNIFKRIIDFMADNFGMSNSYNHITSNAINLDNAAFDTDMSIEEIMNMLVSFGDTYNKPLAWGVNFNDKKEIFVNNYNLTDIKYIIDADSLPEISYAGDMSSSYQIVFGSLESDDFKFKTNDLKDLTKIKSLGGLYKRKKIDLGNIPEDKALMLLTTNLNENSSPTISSSFSVKGNIKTIDGVTVPMEEILSGNMIQVNSFLARESSGDDKRESKTTFFLVGVEVDYENQTVTLTPNSSYSKFEYELSKLSKI